MGWSDCGEDSKGRPTGYGHETTCDQPGCEVEIDRGLSYACGGMHGADDGCEQYYCGEHEFTHNCNCACAGDPFWDAGKHGGPCPVGDKKAFLESLSPEERIAFAETGMDADGFERLQAVFQDAAEGMRPVLEYFEKLPHSPPRFTRPPPQPTLHPSGLNRKQRRKYIGGMK
jgi:hypothetical protein